MTDDTAVRLVDLEERMRLIEGEVELLRATLPLAPPQPQPQPPPPAHLLPAQLPPPTGPTLQPVGVRSTATSPPPKAFPFEFDTEPLLKWGGVSLVVLAVGFALSTAISRGWIGPELQLVGAVGLSLALIVVGLRLRPTRRPWTHALCTGGVLALFTTAASNLFIDQLNETAAFASVAVVGFGAYTLAKFTPSEWVGGASLVGGSVAWLVIGDGEPGFAGSLAWLTVAVVLAMALSLDLRWFVVRFSAHAVGMIGLLTLASDADDIGPRLVLLALAVGLFASVAFVPSLGREDSVWRYLETQLAILGTPWIGAVVVAALDVDGDRTIGLVFLAAAFVGSGVVLLVRPMIRHSHLVSLLVGASVSLSIGLSFLLSTNFTFTALAVQGAGLVILARSLDFEPRTAINAAILLALAGAFVIGGMVDAWEVDAPVGDDIGHLIIIVALAVAGWQTMVKSVWMGTALGVLALALTWLGSMLVHLPQGQAAVSVSWAILGTAVLLLGTIRKVPEVGGAGLVVLALTVGKLLTVDLREVDTLWRAGLFLVVGLGIMRLGFILPGLTDSSDTRRDEPPGR